MSAAIGLDIGGTKIAGAAFDATGHEIVQTMLPTPTSYDGLLETCRTIVALLEKECGADATIGACWPYADAAVNANIPYLIGRDLPADLQKCFTRPVPFGNDANCAALAEASEGAGKNYRAVFGLIMGTGVGGGFVYDGQIIVGPNNMSGEIGHLPLPYYEESDGPRVQCGCGQTGCIEKLIAGPALARLYLAMTNKEAEGKHITLLAGQGDADAGRVLDHYYTVVAKAMVAILHSFDPDIITVSGGLNALPGFYEEVPKRWGQYAICKKPATRLVPAAFGAMAGLRGAAWLGRNG
jgi:fructokinase